MITQVMTPTKAKTSLMVVLVSSSTILIRWGFGTKGANVVDVVRGDVLGVDVGQSLQWSNLYIGSLPPNKSGGIGLTSTLKRRHTSTRRCPSRGSCSTSHWWGVSSPCFCRYLFLGLQGALMWPFQGVDNLEKDDGIFLVVLREWGSSSSEAGWRSSLLSLTVEVLNTSNS